MHDFTDFISAKFHEIWTQNVDWWGDEKLSEQNFENFTVKMSNVLRLQDEVTPLDYRSPETHYQMIPVLDV